MYIDEKRILDEFKRYTDAYDSSNVKIKLKVEHTYRVADLCREIAVSEENNNRFSCSTYIPCV